MTVVFKKNDVMNFTEHCEIASSPFVATQAVGYTEVGGWGVALGTTVDPCWVSYCNS